MKLINRFKQSLRNIFKITILLGIREGYLLVRNVYGIFEHPSLTLGRIVKQRDLSQGILIFGLPIGLWLGWIFILLISRIFIFGRLRFGFLAKASFLASTLFAAVFVSLITYFFYLVLRKERRGK